MSSASLKRICPALYASRSGPRSSRSSFCPSLPLIYNLRFPSYSGFPSFKVGFSALQSEQYYRLEHVVQAVLNLRVTSPFLAMRESSLSPAFLTVPKGAIVQTSNELHQPGLVLIRLEDQLLFAFMRDLRESAEPLGAYVAVA